MTKTDLAVLNGTIDEANGVIAGVSVITVGEAKGHGMLIDEQTLLQVKSAAETYAGGLKVKTDHYTGFDNIVGALKNFVIDGDQLRADLYLLKNHDATPRILEMAQLMPDTFGLSISFSGEHQEDGEGTVFARCSEIYSADLVDTPAANPTGLFSAKVDSAKKDMDESQIVEVVAKAVADALAPYEEDMKAMKEKLASLECKEEESEMAVEVEISQEDDEEEKEEDKQEDMTAALAAQVAELKSLVANFGAKPLAASLPSEKTVTNVTNYDEALAAVKAEGFSGTAATKEVIARYPEIYLAARSNGIRNI